MRTLSIDPSSTATGWAVWYGGDLGPHGVIKPSRKCEADERVSQTIEVLTDMLGVYAITRAVYEEAQKIDAYNRKGIHIYKKAVRVIAMTLVDILGKDNVYTIDPQTWKGSDKKEHTIRKVNLVYRLDLQNKDNDEADAIGIGEWFLKRQKINPIKPVCG